LNSRRFEQENQRHPSVSELSEATNIDEDKIGQSLAADGHHISINAPFLDGEDNCMLDVFVRFVKRASANFATAETPKSS
jgi:DNA-directed RNA polymerase specialized sigma subunit